MPGLFKSNLKFVFKILLNYGIMGSKNMCRKQHYHTWIRYLHPVKGGLKLSIVFKRLKKLYLIKLLKILNYGYDLGSILRLFDTIYKWSDVQVSIRPSILQRRNFLLIEISLWAIVGGNLLPLYFTCDSYLTSIKEIIITLIMAQLF